MTIALCDNNNQRINYIIWAYILGCIISIIISVSGYLSSQNFASRASLEGQDQNIFALIVGLGIFLVWFIRKEFYRWGKLLPLMIGIFLLYGVIISASRTAIAALGLSFFLILVKNRKTLKSIVNCIAISLVVGGIVIIGMHKGLIHESTVDRIAEAKNFRQPATFQEREMIWDVGWRIIKENFITGVGLGNFSSYDKKYTNRRVGRDPHNTFISIFTETGFIGFIISLGFIASLFYLFRSTKSENKITSFCILTFIGIEAMTLTLHTKKVCWFGIALAYLLLTYKDPISKYED